jgi:flavin reductase (DIM6/NTAB) family NADH-FMN oxidoreductase RutF
VGDGSRRHFDTETLSVRESYGLLVQAVGPRPIAFVATRSEDGCTNLAPFSFFNAFGANPVYVAFSPTLRGADGTQKDTLRNVLATKELTVSVVSWDMVEQMNVASAEYPAHVDEFVKSGFTKLPGIKVATPGVAESPVVMECVLHDHISLGGKNASGNLVIARVLLFRVREDVLDAEGRVDPAKADQVGRLGGSWYTRVKSGLFELAKPVGRPIGFDALPRHLLDSTVLTGNDLGRMASVTARPTVELDGIAAQYGDLPLREAHEQIQLFVRTGQLEHAWALADCLASRE